MTSCEQIKTKFRESRTVHFNEVKNDFLKYWSRSLNEAKNETEKKFAMKKLNEVIKCNL